MAEKRLEELNAIASATLVGVVRQDQNNSSFEITEWDLRRLSDKGIDNPDGLWLFSGKGKAGKESRRWSVVLKILERPAQESPEDRLWYWKREYLLAQSSFMESIPVRTPCFYRWEETPNGAWLWMEYVDDHHPGKWTLDEYAFAAHQLGRWNTAYLTGTPLPEASWLTRQHYRTWLNMVNLEEDLKFPLNEKHLHGELKNRYDRLWEDRETFFTTLEGLPQVFSHFDSQRRNLLIHKNRKNEDELVALDWAQCGIGAAGAELNWLVGLSSALREWQASDLPKLDTVCFQQYKEGLQEGGWNGDIRVIRLGTVTMLAVFMGCVFPSITAFWCSEKNQEFAIQILGLAGEEWYLQTLQVLEYVLDCVDGARSLMKTLAFP